MMDHNQSLSAERKVEGSQQMGEGSGGMFNPSDPSFSRPLLQAQFQDKTEYEKNEVYAYAKARLEQSKDDSLPLAVFDNIDNKKSNSSTSQSFNNGGHYHQMNMNRQILPPSSSIQYDGSMPVTYRDNCYMPPSTMKRMGTPSSYHNHNVNHSPYPPSYRNVETVPFSSFNSVSTQPSSTSQVNTQQSASIRSSYNCGGHGPHLLSGNNMPMVPAFNNTGPYFSEAMSRGLLTQNEASLHLSRGQHNASMELNHMLSSQQAYMPIPMGEMNASVRSEHRAALQIPKKAKGGHKRDRKEYEKTEVYAYAKAKLEEMRDDQRHGDRALYLVSDVFKCTTRDKERVITKENPKSKAVTIGLFPPDYLNRNPRKMSQTYTTEKAAENAKARVVELINFILNGESSPWLESGEFDPDKLYSDSKHVDALISVLTVCAKEMCVRDNDMMECVYGLVDPYEGSTIHELIVEANLSTLVPIGTRAPIGRKAKARICDKKGLSSEEFDLKHIKVPQKYSSNLFLKYHKDEIDIVKECIMEEALVRWKSNEWRHRRREKSATKQENIADTPDDSTSALLE